jgi:Permuted papain-like amidase enzyme, YaeF/YiiX, C92 family
MTGGRYNIATAAAVRLVNDVGRELARYLEKQRESDDHSSPSELTAVRRSLEPGDVLLVEGNSRISDIIKYLTQSTWSHAALYVGDIPRASTPNGDPHVLVEAEASEGVVSSPLSKYYSYNVRICRPVGLTTEECRRVCNYAIERIGFDYDLRNLFGLLCCLIPLPLPRYWRRPKSALGTGGPTQIICSALIAQAFDVVRYPILPRNMRLDSKVVQRDLVQVRDSSLCTPRDFDISPYFQIIKPALTERFNYRLMDWIDLPTTAIAEPKDGTHSEIAMSRIDPTHTHVVNHAHEICEDPDFGSRCV